MWLANAAALSQEKKLQTAAVGPEFGSRLK